MILGPTDTESPDPQEDNPQPDKASKVILETGDDEDENDVANQGESQRSEDAEPAEEIVLDEQNQRMDRALSLVYNNTENKLLRRSKLRLNDWLRDIRELFPSQQTLFLQKEAIDRLGIDSLIFEKEIIESLVPDVALIRTILELKDQISPDRYDVVRQLIRRFADEIEEKIIWKLQNTLAQQFEKGDPTDFPKKNEIDWPKTIRKNLKYFQPDLETIMLKRKFGYQKKRHGYPKIYLMVDSSGSMMESMITSAIIGSILSQIRTIETKLILFDHQVVDLTDHLVDAVDLLLHIQMGGGTNIRMALDYAEQSINEPAETYIFLISDLYDNQDDDGVLTRVLALKNDGVEIHCILALQDDPARSPFRYNKELAHALTQNDVPCYAASPDQFPDMLAEVLERSGKIDQFRNI